MMIQRDTQIAVKRLASTSWYVATRDRADRAYVVGEPG
jgi:hypothetical protein